MNTNKPPRFKVLRIYQCSCGATQHEIEWMVTGEVSNLHHGTWQRDVWPLLDSERELLWAGIPVGGR